MLSSINHVATSLFIAAPISSLPVKPHPPPRYLAQAWLPVNLGSQNANAPWKFNQPPEALSLPILLNQFRLLSSLSSSLHSCIPSTVFGHNPTSFSFSTQLRHARCHDTTLIPKRLYQLPTWTDPCPSRGGCESRSHSVDKVAVASNAPVWLVVCELSFQGPAGRNLGPNRLSNYGALACSTVCRDHWHKTREPEIKNPVAKFQKSPVLIRRACSNPAATIAIPANIWDAPGSKTGSYRDMILGLASKNFLVFMLIPHTTSPPSFVRLQRREEFQCLASDGSLDLCQCRHFLCAYFEIPTHSRRSRSSSFRASCPITRRKDLKF
ncbi:hypothetical protein IWX90DRAFT_319775 [Phyllosticta citrichinensis]|uniref:Uncharacterized protein n=1 Tax=Phyllosticta citrichinensis TaxID=1130410 RepID=A0ABR1XJT2_9PEZI